MKVNTVDTIESTVFAHRQQLIAKVECTRGRAIRLRQLSILFVYFQNNNM